MAYGGIVPSEQGVKMDASLDEKRAYFGQNVLLVYKVKINCIPIALPLFSQFIENALLLISYLVTHVYTAPNYLRHST